MINSSLLGVLSLFGLFFFSFLIFFECNLCLVWFFLELSGLSLVLSFFVFGSSFSMVSIFYYLIVSGISSGLLLSGILFSECTFLMVLGLLIKFGVFPFFGWVYGVLKESNWLVIWGLSTVLKSSFIIISFFLIIPGSGWVKAIMVFCCISCLLSSVLFWVFSVNWKVCWCHMVLSSSSVLLYLCFSGSSLDSLLCVFFSYFFWASAVIFFLCVESSLDMSLNNYYLFILVFCFLMLSFPLSFSIFYKICICVSLFSCGIIFLSCWLFYSISEQFYLLYCVTGVLGQKVSSGFSFLV